MAIPPNPHFIQNGIDLVPDTETEKDLKVRRAKSLAGSAFGMAGKAASVHTAGVNVASTARHAVSAISSSGHFIKLRDMSKKVRDGGSLSRMIGQLISLKAMKTTSRTVQTVASVVPGAGMVGHVTSFGHSASLKLLGDDLTTTAYDLHWQAYRELVLLRMQGKVNDHSASGPALKMVREIMGMKIPGRFTLDYLHKPKHINQIMLEPGGWKVLLYKLQQT